MWRRLGSYVYHLILLAVVAVELAALAALVSTFVFYFRSGGVFTNYTFLQVSVGTSLLCILALIFHTIFYPEISDHFDFRRERQYQAWLQRWTNVLLKLEDLPPKPLPPVAVKALLDQRALLIGTDANLLDTLVKSYQLDQQWLKDLNARRLDRRLAALAALEAAVLPQTLPAVLAQMRSRNLLIRISAARCAVRILAAMPDLQPEHPAVGLLVKTLRKFPIPSGMLESILSLDVRASAPILKCLFRHENLPAALLQPIIAAVGNLRLVEMAAKVATYIETPIPAVRVTVLQVLVKLGYFPPAAMPVLREYLYDSNLALDLQAVRLLMLLPLEQSKPLLWEALGHPRWEVRCETVFALLQYGPPGTYIVNRAVREHPVPAAVQIASQFETEPGLHINARVQEWLGTIV